MLYFILCVNFAASVFSIFLWIRTQIGRVGGSIIPAKIVPDSVSSRSALLILMCARASVIP